MRIRHAIRRSLRAAARFARPYRRRRGALVLLYHSIADVASDPWELHVTPRHFGEHLEVLRRQCTLVPLHALPDASASLSGRAVAITFDDGYGNNVEAADQLKSRGMPATMFISAGAAGHRLEFWWDELDRLLLEPGPLPPVLELTVNHKRHVWPLGSGMYDHDEAKQHREWRAWEKADGPRQSLYVALWKLLRGMSHDEREETMMTIHKWGNRARDARPTHRPVSLEELGDLGSDGAVELGAHGVTHTSLSSLSNSAQRDEIVGSKRMLEKLVHRPVTMFAYPFGQQGDYNAATVELVRESGYTHACAAIAGRVAPAADPFQIPRLHVPDCDGARFAQLLKAWFSTP